MGKIKVLFYTELWANAGIESVIMNLFRNFDRKRISVDIMAAQNISDFYDDEISMLGGRKIITLNNTFDSPAKRMIANRKAFEEALKNEQYDIVHIHMCNAAAMIYGKIAKKNGAKIVVYHSHNTNLSTNHRGIKTAIHNFCKWRYEKYGDLFFSCSDLASKWMFSTQINKQGKVNLVKNAIDLDKFAFRKDIRAIYREKLCIGDKFVMGHIGRFEVAKNHLFLVGVFAELHKINSESVLLLIGEGKDEQLIRNKVDSLGLTDSVIFYGTTKEIPQMLWAMDVFVLPSFFEGNPVVGIEAQAASTPCVFADTITQMCKLTNIVDYCSLDEKPERWAKLILSKKNEYRCNTQEDMKKEGYSIKSVALDIQNIYESSLKRLIP